jgi:DoxX-like family
MYRGLRPQNKQTMKKHSITFWITTGIVSAMMLFAGFSYLTNPAIAEAFNHLGFPSYFRIELGTAKLIGAVVLIIPVIPKLIRQFAYFGFALTFMSAFIAHLSSGDPMSRALMPVIFLALLIVSYTQDR